MDTLNTNNMKNLLIALLLTILPIFVHGGRNQSAADTQAFNLLRRRSSIMETMKRAKHAHQLILSAAANYQLHDNDEHGPPRGYSPRQVAAKSALHDCAELYEDTLYHLNRSLGSTNPSDTLTWLSAAVANRETCFDGFRDQNVTFRDLPSSSSPLPRVLSEFSMSLRNALSVNNNKNKAVETAAGEGGRFPSWVRDGDRKLLEGSGGPAVAPKTHVVVAQDGSGDYGTISEAVAASVKLRKEAGAEGMGRFVIYVKRGVYNESVEIKKSMKNIMMIGDGIDATVVTNSKSILPNVTTFRTATVGVTGEGFIARDMTFENTAGPEKHQAVALRSSSDQSVFFRCSFKGYQDTLYVHSMRQFYRDCHIYGTVDFICGDASAVLQSCNIYVRRPMEKQKNTVTAQSRAEPGENSGIVIQGCRVMAADDLAAAPQGLFETYLGRPWRQFSRTLVMKSELTRVVHPAGWLAWEGDFALNTLYYGEYMNTGAGGRTEGRVMWPGFHVIKNASEIEEFTVRKFLDGDSWIPGSGLLYDSGL